MPVEIAGLPAALRAIPEDRHAWLAWQQQALAYRVNVRREIEHDHGRRADVLHAAMHDPLYDWLVFGAVFEPRDRLNPDGTVRKKGWYPWIPYPFQGKMLRWIEQVMSVVPGSSEALLGRGDGILEKPRGMTWSWTLCGYVGTKWKYDDDGFVAGVMSYNQDMVEKTNSTDTLFFKIEGFLGLDKRVPEWRRLRVGAAEVDVPIRSPAWLVPAGYEPARHNIELALSHPERTNVVIGYTTTQRTTTGSRLSVLFLDEAAKFSQFRTVWDSAHAVTDHRLAGSSADIRFGSGFRDLARAAEEAAIKGIAGPAHLRLSPDEHPERDEVWREETEARFSGGPEALAALAREYDLDYEAGHGGHIYREKATKIDPVALSFTPSTEFLDFCIDPGIRDLCAFHLVKYNPSRHRFGLLASYTNSGLPAEFYASLYCASPLTAKYRYGPDEERIMEWFERYGSHIRYSVGDPAGKHRGGGQATSFYTDFYQATIALGRTQGVAIYSSDKPQYKHLQPRHAALRWFLDLLDVNDAPDTIRTLVALKDHHYKAMPEGREIVSLPLEPVHSSGHDRVTALEFLACYHKYRAELEQVASRQTGPPERFTMGGKPLRLRQAIRWETCPRAERRKAA